MIAGVSVALIVIGIVIAVIVLCKKRRRNRDEDTDQLTDFFDSERSSVYTMALVDNVESGMGDMQSRCEPPIVDGSADDDPMFVSEYGVSDDGQAFIAGLSELELGASLYAGAPGRSSILRRPLFDNF
jgi:hypothetical protein